jgi:zinc protease
MLDRATPPAAGTIRPFAAPAVLRETLGNGLTVLAAEHGALPLVTAAVVLDAGGAAEGGGEEASAGVATLTVEALDAGTSRRNAAALADAFESIGAELHTHASWDAAVVQVTVAEARLEAALALLAEVVREPSFPEDEVARVRGEQVAEIVQRRTEPGALASDAALRFIYDARSPYARPLIGTRASVEALRARDAAAFHRRRYGPAGAALLLAGTSAGRSARALAEHCFGDWPSAANGASAEVPAAAGTARTTIYVVDRPGSVQSEIRVGHVGVPRRHPDYFALEVMNSLLGGAFTSRINMNLRERHGFTYGARSGYAYRRGPGPFMIQTAVATDVTARAVEEILKEVRGLRTDGAMADETAAARDYVAGVVPLQLQTTEQIAARLAEIFVHRLGDDYLARFQAGIRGVSVDDVDRVAREQLHTDRLAIVIVGDADAIASPLEAIGAGAVVRAAGGDAQ